MSKPSEILSENIHRPWPLPSGAWQFYQEWNQVLFLHWEVPLEFLRPLIPSSLQPDEFNGKYFISLVPFVMQKVRPNLPGIPSWSVVSDFYEINVRTYVKHGGKQGVFFLNIEAQKALSAWLARTFSGLPYQRSHIRRDHARWISSFPAKGFEMDIAFASTERILQKSPLDKWLTERYCLYHVISGKTCIFEIHHKEWELQRVTVDIQNLSYSLKDISLSASTLAAMHYSEGVQVLTWKPQKVS